MNPTVAPKSITPSMPTFRMPERCPISSPSAAIVKTVAASRLLAANSHILLLPFHLFPDDGVAIEILKGDEGDHQDPEEGIIDAVAKLELSLDEPASVGQPAEEEGERNGHQGIAHGNQPADDPVEGQIAEVSIVQGDLGYTGDGGEVVVSGEAGDRPTQNEHEQRHILRTDARVFGRRRAQPEGLDLIAQGGLGKHEVQ